MNRIESIEQSFFDKDVLNTEYLLRYRRTYYQQLQDGWQLAFKNYESILDCLISIFENNNQYGKSYCSRIKSEPENMRSCEAIMSEAFVHNYYIPLKNENLIKSIELIEKECDLIIEENSNSKRYYEILTLMPDIGFDGVYEIKTQRQKEPSSLRQKILEKIRGRKQFTKNRKNIAAIDLNDISITGNFHVLSSLSNGYKAKINLETGVLVPGEYDWSDNIFDDELTKYIYAVEWFDRGDYSQRRSLINWNYKGNDK
ncbi:MAG: hypothetical protein HY026_07100 [Deltaproteobacteria bacterium]|nr:hypothetical protein [Deltaproteobacteria bacterium]